MPKIVDKEAKRRQIMDAALALFLKKGYKSVTTREIAASAGVSKGILYDYFNNKEDLFYRTIRENIHKKLPYKLALHEPDCSPMERFQRMKSHISRSIHVRKNRIHLMSDFIVNCPDKEFVNEVIGSFFGDARRCVMQIITDAFPRLAENDERAGMYASIFIAFIEGILFQNQFNPENVDLPGTLELFWDVMTRRLREYGTPAKAPAT